MSNETFYIGQLISGANDTIVKVHTLTCASIIELEQFISQLEEKHPDSFSFYYTHADAMPLEAFKQSMREYAEHINSVW